MADSFLEMVVASAATIQERLTEAIGMLPATDADAEVAARWLLAWCQSSAGGDPDLFARRLARDGLSLAEVQERLANARPEAGQSEWFEAAVSVDRALRQGPSADFQAQWAAAGTSLPFEDLLCGVVELSEQRVAQVAPAGATKLLAPTALWNLRLELAQDLVRLCGPIFYDMFARRCMSEPRAKRDGFEDSRTIYEAFVVQMRQGGLRELMRERPVLLRLVATIASQWVDATAEFLGRLDADQAELEVLTLCQGPHVVQELWVAGDRHNHGRAVRRITFTSGVRVFYKPKDLSIDHRWASLVEDLNARVPPVQLRVPRLLSRSGYGWAECIEHLPCEEQEEFSAYFRKAGAWLCLFQLFSGMDMHEQNIVASGNDPVPVDLETLLQPSQVPDLPDEDPRRAYTLAGGAIAESVLSSGLLPGYGRREGRDGVVAHGGLMEIGVREKRVHWHDVNTDQMRPEAQWVPGRPNENRPHFNGAYADIKAFVDDVVVGYEAYANFIMGYVQSVGTEYLLNPFHEVKVRKLIKNTRFYALLLERLCDVRNMQSGAIWSAHLDFVSRFADWTDKDDPWWPLVASERSALAELNIPYFMMSASGSTISDVDGGTAESGLQPGIERARAALEGLSAKEIARQAEMIRLSLSSVKHAEVSLQLRKERRARTVLSRAARRGAVQFETAADAIANQLVSLAFNGRSSAAWLGLDWLQDSSVCQLTPLGADLYNGATGVSLFLAAHARVTGSGRSAELAIAALTALRSDLLAANAGKSARALGIGGSTGLGSILYGLSVIADLTEEKQLLVDALQISRLVSDEMIEGSASLDVMDGLSGALLGLLALYQATNSEEVLHRAQSCGRYLLASEARPNGPGLMPGGLSHGPAGVAHALARLATASPGGCVNQLLEAAERWIQIENDTFCPVHKTWPDARSANPQGDSFWPCQWCHGATGIGLARVAIGDALRVLGEPPRFRGTIEQDIRRAVKAAKSAWPSATDSLCCGSLGGIEFLSEAGRYLHEPALRRLAAARMSETVTEADQEGGYLWDIGDQAVNVGLFRGISGVGYTLLRQIAPNLPNILVWG